MTANPAHTGRKAVIVDSDPIGRKLARSMLVKQGWQVEDFNAGQVALQSLSTQPADVVLVDLSMEGMTGMDICRAIREQPDWRMTRVVAYTAHAQPGDKKTFIANGFDDILIKPITATQLAQLLDSLLESA